MGILTIIVMFAVWSSVFPLCKSALEVSSPLFLTAVRMLLAGVLLLGYLALCDRKAFRLNQRQFLVICLLGLFQIYLTNALECWSLQRLTAAKTCFIYSLGPFFTAFFSYLHFKETMNPRKWLGLLVGFSGILPILLAQKGADELLSSFSFLSWPEIAMICASACTVYGWILLRIVLKGDQGISPLMANGGSMLIGGLMALSHSLFTESWSPVPIIPGGQSAFIQGILCMTFISNILCYNLYGAMLKRFTATFISFLGLLSPIFASLSSWLLLGEPLSPTIFGATAIVSMGAWLVYSAELRQGYTQTTRKVGV